MRPLDPRLLRYASRARLPIATLAALGTLAAALVIASAQFLATAIAGAFTGHRGLTALGTPVIGLAVVIAARAATAWASQATAHRASAAATAQLRRRLLARAVELGPSWLAGQRTAELTQLATKGLDDLDGYFTSYLPTLFLAVVVPLAVLAWITVADPWSGLTIALTLPLVPLFGALIGMATARQADGRWRALGTLAHHFLDVVTGLPTLKVFGRARAQRESIARVTQEYRQATMATLRLAFLSALALELVATTAVALVAVEIGLRLAGGSLDLRTGLLVLILAPEAYLPLRTAAAQFHATANGLAAARQAFAILETPAVMAAPAVVEALAVAGAPAGHVVAQGSAGPGGRVVESIVVDSLSVRHQGRVAPAPDAVSLVIRPGRLTALAGPSGCGKSTLIAAVLGFVQPSAGQILITATSGRQAAARREPRAEGRAGSGRSADAAAGCADPAGLTDGTGLGIDPGDLGLDGWRSLIGWVPQDPTLFPGTIADNIRLGWPGAPESEVRAAAMAAALDDVPLGAVLADRGAGLSAGQRRRLALARALLPGPGGAPRPVLLLDEPTAGLDPATEARVIATLKAEAGRGRAILIVSHHPAVLAAADEVVHVTAPPEPGRADGSIQPPALAEVPA